MLISPGILYNAQDLLLYYPNDPPDSRVFVLQPSNFKLPYESIKIKSKDGFKIHMFLIKQSTNSNHRPTMIFFHGNAGNMGQRSVLVWSDRLAAPSRACLINITVSGCQMFPGFITS